MSTQVTCGGDGGAFAFFGGNGSGRVGHGGGDSGGMYVCGNGVRKFCPPPFLIKLFKMVADSKTNSIISWSLDGTSFIIWDHLKFSSKLLCANFKHDNFSSFIYQLNNYGFRKCGVGHQWEYENRFFQVGRPDLLPLIKRRSHIPGDTTVIRRRRRTASSPTDDTTNNDGADVRRLENLRDEIASSKTEIEMLKNKLTEMESQLDASLAEFRNAEAQWEKVKTFLLAKACREILHRKMRAETEKEVREDDDGKGWKKEKPHQKPEERDDGDGDGDGDVKKKHGDFAYWEEMMLGDDDEGVCHIDGPFEKGEQRAQIAAELLGLISMKPNKQGTALESVLPE